MIPNRANPAAGGLILLLPGQTLAPSPRPDPLGPRSQPTAPLHLLTRGSDQQTLRFLQLKARRHLLLRDPLLLQLAFLQQLHPLHQHLHLLHGIFALAKQRAESMLPQVEQGCRRVASPEQHGAALSSAVTWSSPRAALKSICLWVCPTRPPAASMPHPEDWEEGKALRRMRLRGGCDCAALKHLLFPIKGLGAIPWGSTIKQSSTPPCPPFPLHIPTPARQSPPSPYPRAPHAIIRGRAAVAVG